MNNLRIVYNNLVNKATLSASSEAGRLSVENLKTTYKSQVWRSLTTTETLEVVFSDSEFISLISLPYCNLSSTATMRVRIYDDEIETTLLYDSGEVQAVPPTSLGSMPFGFVPLGANYYSYMNSGAYAYHWVTDNVVVGKKVVVDLVDDLDNQQGYLEASCMVVGAYWSPRLNADYGAEVGFKDTSQHYRSKSGDIRTYNGFKIRTLSFDLSGLDDDEISNIQGILRGSSLQSPIFVSIFPNDEDSGKEQAYQIYGKLSDNNSFTLDYFNSYSVPVDIEEI